VSHKIRNTSVAIALTLTTAACDSSTPAKSNAQQSGQALTETTFAQQQAAVPYPSSAPAWSEPTCGTSCYASTSPPRSGTST
jgi:hypothetical protein